jgi:hypothetical protein
MAEWFETDERLDVLHSLRHASACKREAQERPEMWKWSIIAMHNALQGALACHLSGSQQIGAMKAEFGRQWLVYNQHDRDPAMDVPIEELASVHALFQRATTGIETTRRGNRVEWVSDNSLPPISVPETTTKGFEKLVQLRNDFIHFTPKGWSIELSGMNDIYSGLSDFISKIKSAGWAFRHLSTEESHEMDQLLTELRT